MTKSLLTCKNLSIGYTIALKENLSFNISEEEITFLRGRNGSGKTTLIKTILKEIEPLHGDIAWNIKKSSISYLPQVTNLEAHFAYTIGEILNIYNVPNEFQDFLPEKLLLQNWTKSSGGEKQKAMILTKIHKNTKLLILDEPFNHLDVNSIELVKNLISNLVKEKVISSLLLVSHLKVSIEDINQKEIIL